MICITFLFINILKFSFATVCDGDEGQCEFWHFKAKSLYIRGDSLAESAVLRRIEKRSFLQCSMACDVLIGCSGVAFRDGECNLLDGTAAAPGFVVSDNSGDDYRIMMFYEEEGQQVGHSCTGNCMQCEEAPYIDCKVLLDQGYATDGVYRISPDVPFDAYCEMSNGGWTVIQRRVDDSMDFFKGWPDYKAGFGDLTGNFWAGLDHIQALTPSCATVELNVSMDTFEGEEAWAHYSNFRVGDAASGYTMAVSGYSGTAGDAMAVHNGMKFTTYDMDQDSWPDGNCASYFASAWWYNNCHDTNPNGPMLANPCEYSKGVVWRQFKGYYYSLKSMQFKIRRI